MRNQTEELTYHGHPLDPHPINMRLGDVGAKLRENRTVQVILEPGDATRYDFILSPISTDFENLNSEGVDVIFAGRTIGVGGKIVASATIPNPTDDEWQFERGLEAIGLYNGNPGNEWSCTLFAWWFRKLWDRIEEDGR